MSQHSKFPSTPILCYVTDRQLLLPNESFEDQSRALLAKIASAIATGVNWIQIREKDLSGRELATVTREAIAKTTRSGSQEISTRILINDRLDLALTEDARGVHLGEHSLPLREVRSWLSDAERSLNLKLEAIDKAGTLSTGKFLVGVSCHSLGGAQSAEKNGANYIFFGPIFTTPSKLAFGPPQGLAALAKICSSVSIPVLAIGGITRENAPSCFSVGASGIAAIRLFQDSSDLPATVSQLRLLS